MVINKKQSTLTTTTTKTTTYLEQAEPIQGVQEGKHVEQAEYTKDHFTLIVEREELSNMNLLQITLTKLRNNAGRSPQE